jgi:glycosyltransferase involved in cell wall biosynthesis
MDVSIVVCCYNSAERIEKTLLYLSKQKIEALDLELIIVDNNCTDDTVNIVNKVWCDYNYPYSLTIVSQTSSGQIYARRTGVETAKGDYILFCDDDNWLSSDYVLNVYNLFMANPNAGAIGGDSTAVFEDDSSLPYWFYKEAHCFAVGKQWANYGDISIRGYLWGAGMAIRRKVAAICFEEESPFLLSGRSGGLILSGDDSEICSRVLLMGFKLYYSDALIFYHFIPKNRITESYLSKLKMGFETSQGILGLYGELIKLVDVKDLTHVGFLLNQLKKLPIDLRTLNRVVFWLFGVGFNISYEMKVIRSFHKRNFYFKQG